LRHSQARNSATPALDRAAVRERPLDRDQFGGRRPALRGGRLTHDGQQRATEDRDRRIALSGQSALGPVLDNAADYSVGALVLLISCMGLAYCLALSSFRGGPIFSAMFLGAVGGVALSHLPGLDMISGAAMGIRAMTATMLRLPMTVVLLATLLLLSSGLDAMPLVIISVTVAYVASERLRPPPTAAEAPTPADAAAPSPAGVPAIPTR
jgi:hypothetical protein